jgi:hypothetical protein
VLDIHRSAERVGTLETVRFLGHPDPMDDLASITGQTPRYAMSRSCTDSRDAALELSMVVGAWAPIIECYLDALSFAPAAHMALLTRRGARIVFAPTVADALVCDQAAERRGRVLDLHETWRLRVEYGPEAGVAGVYDPDTDWLVFPTSYTTTNLKRLTLHELGHALTLKRATVRSSLLEGLPTRVHRHVFSAGYEVEDDPGQTLRQRVLEALAEGYTYVVAGRDHELPPALTSELLFMLQTVDEEDLVRFEFARGESGERTASLASEREIVDSSHPEYGHLFAPLQIGRAAEPWDLAQNELARRRRRRSDAA